MKKIIYISMFSFGCYNLYNVIKNKHYPYKIIKKIDNTYLAINLFNNEDKYFRFFYKICEEYKIEKTTTYPNTTEIDNFINKVGITKYQYNKLYPEILKMKNQNIIIYFLNKLNKNYNTEKEYVIKDNKKLCIIKIMFNNDVNIKLKYTDLIFSFDDDVLYEIEFHSLNKIF